MPQLFRESQIGLQILTSLFYEISFFTTFVRDTWMESLEAEEVAKLVP